MFCIPRDRPLWAVATFFVVLSLTGFDTASASPAVAPAKAHLDLSEPFKTRSAWRLIVSEDAAVLDQYGNEMPGLVHLCLQEVPTGPCDPDLRPMPNPPAPFVSSDWEPHYFNEGEIIYPLNASSQPSLLLQTASERSGDGDQAIFTQLLKYDLAGDRFEQIYAHITGRNNNEEVRYISTGPLRGSVISAEPTADAPFAYWVTVDELTRHRTYREVLRYRSATLYEDDNDLPVIDAEMPNIELHLGLWHPGQPLPLPSGRQCEKPQLKHKALWCT